MAYPSYGAGSPLAGGANPTAERTYIDLFKTAYADTIRMKTQNTESVLSDTCVPEVLMGDPLMLDSYTPVDALLQRDRNQQYGNQSNEVLYKTTGNERRQLTPQFWEFAELFDPRDERGLMRAIQPDGMYVHNVAAAFNRKKDDVILDRFLGDVTINGTQLTGASAADNRQFLTAFRKDCENAYGGSINEASGASARTGNIFNAGVISGVVANVTSEGLNIDGTLGSHLKSLSTSATTDPSAGEHGCQQIVMSELETLGDAGSGTASGATTDLGRGLHIKKLMVAHQILQASGAAMGQRIICVLHPEQVTQLLTESKYTSADYNALMPLQYGEPVPFLGMEFRVSNQIASESVVCAPASGDKDQLLSATGRYAYVYTEDANVYGQGDEMSVRFDEIPERGYSLQCYHDFSLGAVRMDPKKMVIIPTHAGSIPG